MLDGAQIKLAAKKQKKVLAEAEVTEQHVAAQQKEQKDTVDALAALVTELKERTEEKASLRRDCKLLETSVAKLQAQVEQVRCRVAQLAWTPRRDHWRRGVPPSARGC